MKPSERIRKLKYWFAVDDLKQTVIDAISADVAQLEAIVQAATDYFEDGITNKEQYAAYERFVVAVQPWFEAEGK